MSSNALPQAAATPLPLDVESVRAQVPALHQQML